MTSQDHLCSFIGAWVTKDPHVYCGDEPTVADTGLAGMNIYQGSSIIHKTKTSCIDEGK
jgi:hypothetical protein